MAATEIRPPFGRWPGDVQTVTIGDRPPDAPNDTYPIYADGTHVGFVVASLELISGRVTYAHRVGTAVPTPDEATALNYCHVTVRHAAHWVLEDHVARRSAQDEAWAALLVTSTKALLRAYASLTHQFRNAADDEAADDLRAQRALVEAEILRRTGDDA